MLKDRYMHPFDRIGLPNLSKKYTLRWVQQTMAATQKLEHAQVFVSHINLFSISTIEKRSFANKLFQFLHP